MTFRETGRLLVSPPPQKLAGVLLLVGSALFFLGLATSESVYTGYNVSRDTISDLGAPIEVALNPPRTLTIQQPASIIYIISLSLLTTLFFRAALLFRRILPTGKYWKVFFVFAAGLVALPLSYIPYYVYAGRQFAAPLSNVPAFLIAGALVHDIFSGLVFFFGGLSAIGSGKLVAKPLDRIFTGMGVLTIVAAVLSGAGIDLGLGFGGIERIVAYPILIWAIAFGAYLLGHTQLAVSKNP